MRGIQWIVGVAVLWSVGVGSQQQVWAQQSGQAPGSGAVDSAVSLSQRVEELDQQVRILTRLRELAADSAIAAAKDKVTPTASAKDGFSLKSADGKYTLRLRGYVQSDGRLYPSTEATAGVDNLLIRRARPIIEATVGRYFDFRLMPDFGGTSPAIFDAYWDGKFAPQFTVRAGKFKPPVGLERLQSATDISFAERGLPTNLVPSRDIGFQIAGDISAGVLGYQVGIFNGVPDLANGGDDLSDAKDFAARVFLQPFKTGSLRGLGLGIGGSTGIERGSTTATGLPTYRTPGQQPLFRYNSSSTIPANTVFANGKRQRLSPQGYFYTGPFGLLGEYVITRNAVSRAAETAELEHTAWQTIGSFFLTGEQAGFRSPTPKKPFDLREGGFGALEVVARYGQLNLDEASFPTYATGTASAQQAKAWGVGLNWHFTRAVKVAVNYERTTFTGGATTGDREPENAVITRFQTSF
ncbi:MAG TPA: porin [Gemmatimonadales bacterium]|nr:porin [Gemmatimonadales bacterium]